MCRDLVIRPPDLVFSYPSGRLDLDVLVELISHIIVDQEALPTTLSAALNIIDVFDDVGELIPVIDHISQSPKPRFFSTSPAPPFLLEVTSADPFERGVPEIVKYLGLEVDNFPALCGDEPRDLTVVIRDFGFAVYLITLKPIILWRISPLSFPPSRIPDQIRF